VFPNHLGTYWDHSGMVKSKWCHFSGGSQIAGKKSAVTKM
jgi:hypothetical protein